MLLEGVNIPATKGCANVPSRCNSAENMDGRRWRFRRNCAHFDPAAQLVAIGRSLELLSAVFSAATRPSEAQLSSCPGGHFLSGRR